MQVTLPWPPREASPNWRGHWATKARAVKQYRHSAWILTMAEATGWDVAELVAQSGEEPRSICMWVDYYPPDRRHRDDDNLIASFKAARDGIADALGVDDKTFRIHPVVREETRQGGQVVVTITQAEDQS